MGKRRKEEVEGREREGPQVNVEQGPSEPCYATVTTSSGNFTTDVFRMGKSSLNFGGKNDNSARFYPNS